MTRHLITIHSNTDRERAAKWAMGAPVGMRVEFKQAKRSSEQNDKLWAMLTEVAAQLPWHGIKLAPDDWKFIFMDALKRELRVVPNIDGTGFVNLGRSSSDLSKGEMSDLIELIHAFGAQHGVAFKEDSNSTEQEIPRSNAQSDAPAAGDSRPSDAAGKPFDWKPIYVRHMESQTDPAPKSLLSRHTAAIAEIKEKSGKDPDAGDLEEMRAIYGLRQRNLTGAINADDYRAGLREIVGEPA